MQIIAVDFDGTVVMHEYPEVGADVPEAVRVLNRLYESGTQFILWTMRSGAELMDAIAWFTERGIPLWGVNENPEQHLWTASPKAYAPLYIDDAALGCPLIPTVTRGYVDWLAVERELERRGYFA